MLQVILDFFWSLRSGGKWQLLLLDSALLQPTPFSCFVVVVVSLTSSISAGTVFLRIVVAGSMMLVVVVFATLIVRWCYVVLSMIRRGSASSRSETFLILNGRDSDARDLNLFGCQRGVLQTTTPTTKLTKLLSRTRRVDPEQQ
jgi:hypothetical protein